MGNQLFLPYAQRIKRTDYTAFILNLMNDEYGQDIGEKNHHNESCQQYDGTVHFQISRGSADTVVFIL